MADLAFKGLKLAIILACFTFFIASLVFVGKKFQDSDWITAAKREESDDELSLPQVTICASKPYKDYGNVAVPALFADLAYD